MAERKIYKDAIKSPELEKRKKLKSAKIFLKILKQFIETIKVKINHLIYLKFELNHLVSLNVF